MKLNKLTLDVVEDKVANKPLRDRELVKCGVLALCFLLAVGCAQQPDYILAKSHKQIKQVQILDPNAPERNDGIILVLEGNYGKNVVKKYQRSVYDMKASRQMKQSGQDQ